MTIIVLLLSIFLLLGTFGIVYIGTYNHNLSFKVNLFSFFSWLWLKILFGRGREEDKSRAITLRNYITPSRSRLPKIDGIVTTVLSVPVRDGSVIDVYMYTPSAIVDESPKQQHQLIFFCHGGGWIMANRWSNERIICEYALKTNSIAIYINYRLAPEYQHPTAIYDCYDVYKHILDHHSVYRIDVNRIVLLGDSAGGMICFGVCELAIAEYRRQCFSKMVLIYPAMDSRTVPEGDFTWDERNLIYNNTFGLSFDAGYTMCAWYFPDYESITTPLGSPVVEDNFEYFPPTRFFTVEYDTLRIATKVAYEKMKKAGLDVKYTMIKGGVHAIWGSKSYDCGLNDLVLAELSFFCIKHSNYKNHKREQDVHIQWMAAIFDEDYMNYTLTYHTGGNAILKIETNSYMFSSKYRE